MNENNRREGTFIPCGDAFEKMSIIDGVSPANGINNQEKKDEENPEVSG